MRYLVIAECVDARTGKRFFRDDEFLPEPDEDQAARLIEAECLREMPAGAPELPRDDLDGRTVAQLREIAKREEVDIGNARSAEKIAELIRTKREHVGNPTLDYVRDSLGNLQLDRADKSQLLAIAAYEQAVVPEGDTATDAELREAIEAKRLTA